MAAFYELKGHTASVLCLATGPIASKERDFAKTRTLLLSGSEDATVRLWDMKTRKVCVFACFTTVCSLSLHVIRVC